MKRDSVLRVMVVTVVVLSFFFVTSAPVMAQATMAGEKAAHPRIMKAIKALENAIAYMEAAPHDFGGHKAAAIGDSKKAVIQLKEALKYREVQDEKRMKKR